MGELLGLLLILGVFTLWIVAFVRMQKYGASTGVGRFFLCLGLTILAVGLMFLVIMVPVMDCSGWLCGLGELLIFMGLSLIVLVVMPIVMMTAMVAVLKRKTKREGTSAELIDG